MFARVAFVVFLAFLFASSIAMSEDVVRALGARTAPLDAASRAAKEMEVARYYAGRGNFADAATRFRVVVTRFQSSPVVDEALFRLVEVYLKLGIRKEAQTAAAVLNRQFPHSQWCAHALGMLTAAGLEPAEDQSSWISLAFR